MYAKCSCKDLLMLAYTLPHPETSRLQTFMLERENEYVCVCVYVSTLQVDTMVMIYKQKKIKPSP